MNRSSATPSDADSTERVAQTVDALAGLVSWIAVEAAQQDNEGLGLVATQSCQAGDVLCSASGVAVWSEESDHDELATSLLIEKAELTAVDDAFYRLVVKVAYHRRTGARSPLAAYLQSIPVETLSAVPCMWPEHGLLRGSGMDQLLAEERLMGIKQLKELAKRLQAAGVDPELLELHWAWMFVCTRGMECAQRGHLWCPGIDLANHRDRPNAWVRLSNPSTKKGLQVDLIATTQIACGTQVTIDYDPDACCLELWMRLGLPGALWVPREGLGQCRLFVALQAAAEHSDCASEPIDELRRLITEQLEACRSVDCNNAPSLEHVANYEKELLVGILASIANNCLK